MSRAPEHRTARYTLDLLSPAELQLLRHPEVVRERAGEPDLAIIDWELVELPG